MFRNFQGLLRTNRELSGRPLFQRQPPHPSPVSHIGIVACSWFHTSQARHTVPRRTHYAVLGVHENANAQEIKSAYYKLSKRWHPDTNKGTAEDAHKMFLKISEAYSVLGNDRSRKDYDRTLLRAGGPSRRTDGSGFGSPSMYHRYRNASSAFSSSGEYSSAKRTDYGSNPSSNAGGAQGSPGYRRPQGTYARNSAAGPQGKSNFEEWERKHYWELKKKAEHIDMDVRESARRNKYSNWQISIYQFVEIITAFTIVFAAGWAGKHLIHLSDTRSLSTRSGIPVAAPISNDRPSLRNGQRPNEKE
ncbi:hypothetical protein IW140_005221 [Coemansia sp. RSA 1813]|nr:hypothetical protein EV178_002410 [Coemansia sp. RSA 1646]KAJ1768708.1 hypothetical protein LPJ74_004672 [Coemansia sp. RSA 1843]KAJ2093609.1 hypothetical protein IW138_000002 [Coemansia sp. RSA 986]KAJ2215006.1 hypothetical protein EV179_002536 [Coemansia sp. RSA 487]KAJ2565756.1 hypothetical protein IW140_005221 [Coemansia sp. RSA 1813]